MRDFRQKDDQARTGRFLPSSTRRRAITYGAFYLPQFSRSELGSDGRGCRTDAQRLVKYPCAEMAGLRRNERRESNAKVSGTSSAAKREPF
jgi:hypothetical protein